MVTEEVKLTEWEICIFTSIAATDHIMSILHPLSGKFALFGPQMICMAMAGQVHFSKFEGIRTKEVMSAEWETTYHFPK